jgi:hypothetical protein
MLLAGRKGLKRQHGNDTAAEISWTKHVVFAVLSQEAVGDW